MRFEIDLSLTQENLLCGYSFDAHKDFLKYLLEDAVRCGIESIYIIKCSNDSEERTTLVMDSKYHWLFTFQLAVYRVFAASTCTLSATDTFFAQSVERIKRHQPLKENDWTIIDYYCVLPHGQIMDMCKMLPRDLNKIMEDGLKKDSLYLNILETLEYEIVRGNNFIKTVKVDWLLSNFCDCFFDPKIKAIGEKGNIDYKLPESELDKLKKSCQID